MILGSFNGNLTSHFEVIALKWLTFFLGRSKWYQNNLIIPCGIEAVYDMNLDKDVKDLSGGDCDTPKS